MKKALTLILFYISFSQNVEMTSYVLDENLSTNNVFDFYIELKWTGKSSDYFTEINELPKLDGLELKGSGASNKVINEDNVEKAIKILTYKLKPTRHGEVFIAPITVKITNAESTESVFLTSQLLKLKITKYIPPTKIDDKIWYLIIAVIIVLGLIVLLILRRAKNNKKNLEQFADITSKFIETKLLNKCSTLVNEPDRLEKTKEQFISYYEEYINSDEIDKNTLTLLNHENSDLNKEFVTQVNEIRYSGETPNTIDLEKLIENFKLILKNNSDLRKDMEK